MRQQQKNSRSAGSRLTGGDSVEPLGSWAAILELSSGWPANAPESFQRYFYNCQLLKFTKIAPIDKIFAFFLEFDGALAEDKLPPLLKVVF